ncbi:hypothetical protein RhiirA1_524458 [Rhizophagus irregularis]|uniref:Uncharacterized protein n=1 Tax=Rhizophagus irregularis TaxID=588596 RepID=A0A2I1EX59_9GLOM|nr:hypothetical protein RhiirA1_524458 [Rhizophagus irregularis]PKY26706.1 hypothetical protein RhiirB3_514172 [Rhizophagus irregularis]
MGIDIYLPRNDVAFREMLQSLVSKNNLKFTVFIEKPSKPFNEWTFPKVCELYGLSDNPNHSIDVYPIFRVGRTIGLIEVKKDDFKQGFAQVTEMDSSLSRKRKANEIDDEYDMDKSMGDCNRCGKIILHGMYTRRCGYEDKVEKVLAHIIRLLEEAQKPIEASQSGEGSRK